jgi:hypothetical protein
VPRGFVVVAGGLFVAADDALDVAESIASECGKHFETRASRDHLLAQQLVTRGREVTAPQRHIRGRPQAQGDGVIVAAGLGALKSAREIWYAFFGSA